MAKILNGILGGFSGKVGTVVGACWKGIDYMRALATSVTNPKTPAQLAQRARFSLVIAFLRPLTAFLRIGFKSAALKMSAFNAAMAYNVKNAIAGTYPSFAINYQKVLLSRGSLAGALNPKVVPGVAGVLEFSWDDNSEAPESSVDDQAILIVINPVRNQAIAITGGASRQTRADSMILPELFSGDSVECYIAFANDNESEISDSQWVGSAVVV